MRRKFIYFSAAFLVITSKSAIAADIAIPAFKAAPTGFNWSGCYIGAQAGGGVMNDSFTSRNGFGGLLGGQGGCNYQLQATPVIIGLEGEGWASSISNENLIAGISDTKTSNRWDTDVDLRVGLAIIDRVMSYAKGGVAWGNYAYSGTTLTGNATLPGLLIGGGVEYAFTQTLIGRVEYDSIFDRGTVSYSGIGAFTGTESATKQVIKVGVSYLFH